MIRISFVFPILFIFPAFSTAQMWTPKQETIRHLGRLRPANMAHDFAEEMVMPKAKGSEKFRKRSIELWTLKSLEWRQCELLCVQLMTMIWTSLKFPYTKTSKGCSGTRISALPLSFHMFSYFKFQYISFSWNETNGTDHSNQFKSIQIIQSSGTDTEHRSPSRCARLRLPLGRDLATARGAGPALLGLRRVPGDQGDGTKKWWRIRELNGSSGRISWKMLENTWSNNRLTWWIII